MTETERLGLGASAIFAPNEIFALLRQNHLPNLAEEELRILSARVCGWKPRQIAERLFVSERTVQRALARLQAEVCAPSGVADDIAVLAFWFSLHVDCPRACAARGLELIATGQVLPNEDVA